GIGDRCPGTVADERADHSRRHHHTRGDHDHHRRDPAGFRRAAARGLGEEIQSRLAAPPWAHGGRRPRGRDDLPPRRRRFWVNGWARPEATNTLPWPSALYPSLDSANTTG